jgi:hypothetical protein
VLVPMRGTDLFEQEAEASNTFLRYELELSYEVDPTDGRGRMRLRRESLDYITKRDARRCLAFPHREEWVGTVLKSSQRRTSFIRTDASPRSPAEHVVRLQQDRMRDADRDKRGGGSSVPYRAATLPRTVLSGAQNADEHRTAVLLREEMRSWRILQLEPTALRRPDDFQDTPGIDASGAHVPATLFGLATRLGEDREAVYSDVANRLSELVDDVASVTVDRDDTRRVARLVLTDRHGVALPASSLSDGTLRFVALAVMARDPGATGLLCLEEPENGIHPERLGAMWRLLTDLAVDAGRPVGHDNPLRQVIVSTHSPLVAGMADRDELVFLRFREHVRGSGAVRGVEVLAVPESVRANLGYPICSVGSLFNYVEAAGAWDPQVDWAESSHSAEGSGPPTETPLPREPVRRLVTRQLSLFAPRE